MHGCMVACWRVVGWTCAGLTNKSVGWKAIGDEREGITGQQEEAAAYHDCKDMQMKLWCHNQGSGFNL